MPANGAISVTAYLSVTAGFIDLNDTVQMEAIVKDDGATVVTLDNPTVTPLLPPVLSEYEDTFPTIGSYGGTTGRTTWVPDRMEELDDNSASGGDIRVRDEDECPSGNCIDMKTKGVGYAVYRECRSVRRRVRSPDL